MVKRFSILLVFMMTAACQHAQQVKPTNNPVLGAWKLISVSWISAQQTHTIEQAQPGMFLFTPHNYALMWSPKQTPRTPFKNLSKPTDEEVLAGFKSVVFNAGSYEITNDKIVTTAHVAKVPGFEGGQIYYDYVLDGNQLLLTMYDETYPDGNKPDWSGKWQTQFTLIKAQ